VPRTASACQDGRCRNPIRREPSVGKSIRKLSSVPRVWLDLAKKVFQVHAVDANGEIVVARQSPSTLLGVTAGLENLSAHPNLDAGALEVRSDRLGSSAQVLSEKRLRDGMEREIVL
jgi:hypothetical protein